MILYLIDYYVMKYKSNFETVQSGEAKNLFGYKSERVFFMGETIGGRGWGSYITFTADPALLVGCKKIDIITENILHFIFVYKTFFLWLSCLLYPILVV